MMNVRHGTIKIESIDGFVQAHASILEGSTRVVVKYKEPFTNMGDTQSTITFHVSINPSVQITRKGQVSSKYAFVRHRKTAGYYLFPEGQLDVQVDTHELMIMRTEKWLRAKIDAEMTLDKTETIKQSIEIQVDFNTAEGREL